jgi:hypothetical protein
MLLKGMTLSVERMGVWSLEKRLPLLKVERESVGRPKLPDLIPMIVILRT